MRKLLLIVVSLLVASQAFAVEELVRPYRGVRSLGMGGLLTTTGIYDESLFGGNPAMQLEAPAWKLTILAFTAESNTNFLKDTSKVNEVKSASGTDVLQKIADTGLAGRNEHYRISTILPAFYSPRFFGDNTSLSAGLLLNNSMNLMLRSNTQVEAQALLDIGPRIGVAHRFLDGNLNVGVNTAVVYRVAGDPTFTASHFIGGQKIGIKDIAGQGMGIDADLGALYKLPFSLSFLERISIGGSLNNLLQSTYRVAGTELVSSIGKRAPINNNRTGSLGARFDLADCAILTDNLFALEWQDIGTTRQQSSFWKKFHMGAETRLIGFLSVRAGVNQGYATGGLGFDLPVVKIDVATYAEELGANTGRLEDRRIIAKLSFDT